MGFPLGVSASPIVCKAIATSSSSNPHAHDASYIQRAAVIADKSAGFTSPHPNFGCVIVAPAGKVAGEGYLYAQGTKPAEVQAVEAAGRDLCKGATAYLNMEPGDCYGDRAAVSALIQVLLNQKSLLTYVDRLGLGVEFARFSIILCTRKSTPKVKLMVKIHFHVWDQTSKLNH